MIPRRRHIGAGAHVPRLGPATHRGDAGGDAARVAATPHATVPGVAQPCGGAVPQVALLPGEGLYIFIYIYYYNRYIYI